MHNVCGVVMCAHGGFRTFPVGLNAKLDGSVPPAGAWDNVARQVLVEEYVK